MLAQLVKGFYRGGMGVRHIHDTAFGIASVLTEKMEYKLVPGEREAFHRMVYETCKAAIEQHEAKRDGEEKRLAGRSPSPCE